MFIENHELFPTLDHVTLDDSKDVYEPSDDTFLLCDAIELDKVYLSSKSPLIIVEIGSGSGCVITFTQMLLKRLNIDNICFATDINPKALVLTRKTASANKAIVNVILSDLGSSLLKSSVDVLIFNPPYVPTPSEEIGSDGIEASWAGGKAGREVIDRFLPIMKDLLTPGGCCYLLLVQENKPAQIQHLMSSWGMVSQIILRRQARNEHLLVLRIEKNSIQ